MLKVLTAQEMRDVDRLTIERFAVPSVELMEHAAGSVAAAIEQRFGGSVAGRRVLIICGRGNNGGDGAALARILFGRGADVEIHLFGTVDGTKGDARTNFDRCVAIGERDRFRFYQSSTADSVDFSGRDCVVDAMFGTGVSRPIADVWAELADCISRSGAFRVAVDLPSGLDSDRPAPIGPHSVVDATVTFTAPKLANVFPPASRANGELIVADIGSPRELIDESPSRLFVSEASDAREWLRMTEFASDSHKYKRGHAFLLVGSRDYAGAAALAGNAAMRSGAGLVTVATSRSAQTAIASKLIDEIITRGLDENESGRISASAVGEIAELTARATAVAIGCGLGVGEDMRFVRTIVADRKTPMIVDAGGLTALSPFDLQGSGDLPLVLTPHDGEFLRLLGTGDKNALQDRIGAARGFAAKHSVILLLKGERVLIAAPDGRVVINPTGTPGLGKAGNGDTLAGILAGFAAQAAAMGIGMFETVVAAVYVAGVAGQIAAERFGDRTMTAGDVREMLVEAFRRVGGND